MSSQGFISSAVASFERTQARFLLPIFQPTITQDHYVKESSLATRAREAAKKIEEEKQQQEAACVLDQELERASQSLN